MCQKQQEKGDLTQTKSLQIQLHDENAEGFDVAPPPQPLEQQPVTRVREKTRRKVIRKTITGEEFSTLTAKGYPEPDFEVLTNEQVSKLSKKKKEEYNRKLTAFDEKVQAWVESETKRKAKASEALKVKLEGETWPSLEADPDAMDQALEQNSVDSEESLQLSEREYKSWKYRDGKSIRSDMALEQYMAETSICNQMNEYLRTGRGTPFGKMNAETAVEGMKGKELSRDMVARRGTSGYSALAGMLGLSLSLKPEELQSELQRRTESGEDTVLTEKGFCSTSLVSNKGYQAGGEGGGIEFVILARRGTCAIDYRVGGSRETEQELLIGAGTKFKLVKAYFGDRKASLGAPGSWKIYLESIPQGDDSGVAV